jgi:chloride channel protein, CIC family
MLLPLLLAVTIAHGFTCLTLKRSILTEKVSRRGYHLSREYAVDPLEILFVREVMRTNIVALPASGSVTEAVGKLNSENVRRGQMLYPLVADDGRLHGVITRTGLQRAISDPAEHFSSLAALAKPDPVIADAGEPLRVVVHRMAETGFTRLPVLDASAGGKLVGMVSLNDLLRARTRSLEEERRRERVLRLRIPFGRQAGEVSKT